jgi:FkbM family methyltransferase
MDFTRDAIYGHDTESQNIFDFVVRYRTVRAFFEWNNIPFAIENAPYTKEQWAELENKANLIPSYRYAQGDTILDRIDTWLLESYTLHNHCRVSTGDIVFDCGAFTGNTSMYFSKKAGGNGHVYCFEPSHKTRAQLKNNLQKYKNSSVYPFAVFRSNQNVIFDAGNAEGSCISKSGITVRAITLDSFARDNGIPRVDFIKMDIEGGEVDAIEGATGIIQQYTPKMAISAYHRTLDVVMLPKLILSINKNYKFYLRHYSNREFETVLFCAPVDSPNLAEFNYITGKEANALMLKNIFINSFQLTSQGLMQKSLGSYNLNP